MVGLVPRLGPGALAARLAALEVQLDGASVARRGVVLPDYPGGPRPSSVLQLSGGGMSGYGENVAFFEPEHEAFEATISKWATAQRGRAGLTVSNGVVGVNAPYERAALEAALIDLALRQAGLSLADLTGVHAAELRFVLSLAADPAPLSQIQRVRAQGFTGDIKLDVDASWDDATLAALAEDASIVIFDFKGKADAALAERLARLRRDALLEDPPSGFEPGPTQARISRDASVLNAQHAMNARVRGEAVNLKAPRMGGPLEVLRGLDAAFSPQRSAPSGAPVAYLGGMFEVAVGRTQARQLAALYCATGPNDLAPNVPSSAQLTREASPILVRLDQPGFG